MFSPTDFGMLDYYILRIGIRLIFHTKSKPALECQKTKAALKGQLLENIKKFYYYSFPSFEQVSPFLQVDSPQHPFVSVFEEEVCAQAPLSLVQVLAEEHLLSDFEYSCLISLLQESFLQPCFLWQDPQVIAQIKPPTKTTAPNVTAI